MNFTLVSTLYANSDADYTELLLGCFQIWGTLLGQLSPGMNEEEAFHLTPSDSGLLFHSEFQCIGLHSTLPPPCFWGCLQRPTKPITAGAQEQGRCFILIDLYQIRPPHCLRFSGRAELNLWPKRAHKKLGFITTNLIWSFGLECHLGAIFISFSEAIDSQNVVNLAERNGRYC